MASRIEQRIAHKRRRTGILVPMIEDFLRETPRIESEEDRMFMELVFVKQSLREEQRRGKRVFSPSSLASCMRQVYLKRNYDKHGLVAVPVKLPEPGAIFVHGDWLHYKWQFILWKMHLHPDYDFKMLDFEASVASKHGDHGGTLDIVAEISGEPYIIDVKGINVRAFKEATQGRIETSYRVQLADYIMLANVDKEFRKMLDGRKIEKGILLAENKGGPDRNYPAAVHEVIVTLKQNKPDIQARLEILRNAEANQEIPPPECTSTTTFQFQGCPFSSFCRREVKAIQAERQSSNSEWRVAKSIRRRRRR